MTDHHSQAISLYIHMPWCVQKCPYCDFNSHALRQSLPETAYLQALLTDIASMSQYLAQRPLSSIFIGGGTPSLFQASSIHTLLQHLRQHHQVTDDVEITMEANPGTVERQSLVDYVDAGINRLSLGIQSFDDTALKRLGRIHGSQEAHRAIDEAQSAGLDSFNLDLMYGLPGQTTTAARADLQQALAHAPHHISWYQLTLEPHTAFFHQQPQLPDDGSMAAIETMGLTYLADRGYQRYEVSAFAQSGWMCRHNLNYWTYGDYVGVGAGAHSKITIQPQHVLRLRKPKHPKAYLAHPTQVFRSHIEQPSELLFEFMLNHLRLRRAIHFCDIARHTGMGRDAVLVKLQPLMDRGWITSTATELNLTARGYDLLDELTRWLLPSSTPT